MPKPKAKVLQNVPYPVHINKRHVLTFWLISKNYPIIIIFGVVDVLDEVLKMHGLHNQSGLGKGPQIGGLKRIQVLP